MKRGLTRLLALLVALFLVLGTTAACGKKKASTDSGTKDTTVEESTPEESVTDADESTPAEESTTVDESTEESTDATVDTTKDEDTKAPSTKAETTKQTPSSSSKTNTPGKTTPVKPGPVGKVDLKGYTVKVAAWWNLDPKTPGNVYYQKAVDREKAVRAKYNVKFKFINVPGQGLRDKIPASVMAGDPIGDIIRCRSGWVLPVLAGKGYVEPADKYFDVSDPLWNPYITKQSFYKGHPMGVNHGGITSFTAMLYNRSMIQRAGLADPQTLVASKQWTWAKYEDYVKKLAKDTNNDGKLEQYGTTNPDWVLAVASNGSKVVSEIGGKDVYTLGSPAAVEALKWVQSVRKMNVAGGDLTDFANGKVGFVWWYTYDNGFRNTMKDKWGIVPFPMGPKAKDYAAWYDEVHLMTIPANSKHPKETAAIWTDLSRWYPGTNREIMLRDNFENAYNDKKDVDMAIYIATKFWLDKWFAYNGVMDELWPGGGQDIDNVLDGSAGKSIDQWTAEKSAKMQNIIDQLWASFTK